MDNNNIMDLMDYTNKWLAGEIREDIAIVIAGVILLILSIITWLFGISESAKAMVIPLLIVAILLMGLGSSLAFNNYSRKVKFK